MPQTVVVLEGKKVQRHARFLEKNTFLDIHNKLACTLGIRYPLLIYSKLPDKNIRMWVLSPTQQRLQSLTQYEYCKLIFEQHFNSIKWYEEFPINDYTNELTKAFINYQNFCIGDKLPIISEMYNLGAEFFWQLPIVLSKMPK